MLSLPGGRANAANPLLPDTRRLEKALGRLGARCEARYYPGGIHAFHAMVWQPLAKHCWRDALAFLDRHTRPAAAAAPRAAAGG